MTEQPQTEQPRAEQPQRHGEAVTRSFVSLATGLALGSDIVELLTRLATDCADLLDIRSAGLLLGDDRGVLHVMAASSEAAQEWELFQTQRVEGPCLECFRTGAPVSVADLGSSGRWPTFTAAAREHGYASVHALPMRLRTRTLGTLGLFGSRPGRLRPDDLRLAQALADVAGVALLQQEAALSAAAVTSHLQSALTARVLVEQAKGVLAYTGDMSTDAAFAALRGYADRHRQPLSAVADQVVHGRLPAPTVLREAGT